MKNKLKLYKLSANLMINGHGYTIYLKFFASNDGLNLLSKAFNKLKKAYPDFYTEFWGIVLYKNNKKIGIFYNTEKLLQESTIA